MRIEQLLTQERAKFVEISAEQERLLKETFGSCPNIECMIVANKTYIEKSLSMEKQCFILHTNGSMDKILPAEGELFFGVFISTLTQPARYIIALPA